MDVIKQLIGDVENWDQCDTFSFVFGNPSKFPDHSSACIDFETGVVHLYKNGVDAPDRVFFIHATLGETEPT